MVKKLLYKFNLNTDFRKKSEKSWETGITLLKDANSIKQTWQKISSRELFASVLYLRFSLT